MLLVIGASGFLGANLTLHAIDAGRDVVGVWHQRPLEHPGLRTLRADLSRPGAAAELLRSTEPDWVINCAALANVDESERNPVLAGKLNTELPRALAEACADSGARLLHVSTDAVFDGMRGGYTEADEPRPNNVYAATKLEGERAVQSVLPDALIVRTNFIGISPVPGVGLADWIVTRLERGERVPGFTDVVFSPLLANDLAALILDMIDRPLDGVYHALARDACSKHDFAVMLCEELGFDCTLVERSKLADASLYAPRSMNTSLATSRLESALGRPMPSVRDAVSGYAELRRTGYANRFNPAGVS